MPPKRSPGSKSQARPRTNTKATAPTKKAASKPTKAYSKTKILIDEPSNLTPTSLQVRVPTSFVAELRKAPKVLVDEQRNNAYVFGPLYPICKYKKVGENSKYRAETGIFQFRSSAQIDKFHSKYDILDDIYDLDDILGIAYYQQWESRDRLKKAQKMVSNDILFIGATYSGDEKVKLYVHRDADGKIDSLILDSSYFIGQDDTELPKDPEAYKNAK